MNTLPFYRPRLVVSQCLGFAAVRYNGAIIHDEFVQQLERTCDVVEVCPEVAIGLGVPRPPIRMELRRSSAGAPTGHIALVQPSTNRDISIAMDHFADSFMSTAGDVDGFILKARSPSCGVADVSVFDADGTVAATAPGRFASVVLAQAGGIPVQDEVSLRDHAARTRFLTRVHALRRLRQITDTDPASLVAFHTAYKYLLMAHHPDATTALGRMVAEPARPGTLARYRSLFLHALAAQPSRGRVVNALSHMFGYASSSLTPSERAAFLEQIEQFRAGRLDLATVNEQLLSIVQSANSTYIEMQAWFVPFPRGTVM